MNYYDILYKNIYIDKPLKKIINTIEFQRLRFIKQLGLSYFVFPSAVHTRFEHSIGVSYLSGLLLTSIKQKQPELFINDHDILLVKIAGLIHDLGHACYSHFFDKLLDNIKEENNYKNHEERSILLFKKLIPNLNLDISEEDIIIICELINPKRKIQHHRLSFIYEIVCNNINGLDCDKIDYLMRDCKYLNNNNTIDYHQIIDNSRVINNRICYPDNIALILNNLYNLRYINHKIFYQHPDIRAIEYMMMDAIKNSEYYDNMLNDIMTSKFYEYTDSILERLLYTSKSVISKDLINRILVRKLYKYIDEIILLLDTEEKYIKLTELITAINEFTKLNGINDYFIIEVYNLNYSMGKCNPLEKIKFYSFKDINKSYNLNYNKISKLLPDSYEETIVRIFIKTDVSSKIKINNLDILFPGITDEKIYTYEELGELFILYLTMLDSEH